MIPLVPRPPLIPHAPDAGRALSQAGIDPWVARALAWRGVDQLPIALGQYRLLPYQGLKGIQTMAEQLADAIERQTPMVIVADYDCDGATACAVGVSGLRALGASIDFIVPNRFEHGYGLTPPVVHLVKARFPDTAIIVTVDNGIASNAGVAEANALGMKVLVTDHHLPGEVLPDAAAIVNPNQPGDTFASKNLAGVGVMYYTLAATRDALKARGALVGAGPNLADWLDLVALGTVADVVKLDDNNRWLVRQGLQQIRQDHTRPGIRALFAVSRRDQQRATAQDFGFSLGPRINAAGRLQDMSIGIRCLLAEDDEEAGQYAQQLDALNRERKEIGLAMEEGAWRELDLTGQEGRFTRVVYDEHAHEGVIGIVAGRIKEVCHTPTLVLAKAHEPGGAEPQPNAPVLVKGSGRSIPGLHLRDALDLVHKRGHNLFTKFGGHAMAAGVTFPLDRLEDFKRLFEEAVAELLDHRLPQKTLPVDHELPTYAICEATADALANEVWGQGFEEPIWSGEFTLVDSKLIGADANHLKMVLERDGEQWEAMHFFCTERPEGTRLRLAYRLALNEFRGERRVNLMVVEKEVIG